MLLEQKFQLPHKPKDLWPAFNDLALLVSCLPGASVTGAVGQTDGVSSVPLRFEVKLGPISAAFVGKGALTLDEQTLSGCFEGSAVDRKTNSRVNGTARFSLVESDSPPGLCTVVVKVEYALAGSLAQFNRAGIVRQLADTLTLEFAKRLEVAVARQLSVQTQKTGPESGTAQAMESSQGGAATSNASIAAGSGSASLNPLALIGLMLRQKFSRLIAKLKNQNAG